MNHANILVVDDESLVRWSLKERLEAQGYDVIEAETSAEALRQPVTEIDLVAEVLDGLGGRARLEQIVAVGGQPLAQRPAQQRLIVDNKDGSRGHEAKYID